MDHQPDLGVEESPVLCQGPQVFVGGISAVLHLRASGERGRADRRPIGMNNTAQSLGFGLAAGCLQLFVAERRSTALANAARGKDLDHVGAIGLQPPDRFTNLLRRQPGINNRAERRQESVGRLSARAQKSRILGLAVGLEDAPQGVADRVRQRIFGIGKTAIVEPSVGGLLRQRPPHVGEGGIRVTPVVFVSGCLEQAPGHVRIVGAVARHGVGRGMLAPGSVGILCGDQPIRGTQHGRPVLVPELAHAIGQANQDLPGVERDGGLRQIADMATLEGAFRKLDGDEPIEHPLHSLSERVIAAQSCDFQQRRNDVASGFRIGCAPSREQTEVPSHSAVLRR